LALGARGFILAENERFKLVLAILANVLENRHLQTPQPIAGQLGTGATLWLTSI